MSVSLWYDMVKAEQGDTGDHYPDFLDAERRLNVMSREQFVNRLQAAVESRYGLTPKEES